MTANIGNPEIWSQFGLAGLVIFALFGLVVLLVYKNMDAIKSQASEHKSERREWRESNGRQADRFENAVNNLVAGLRDTK